MSSGVSLPRHFGTYGDDGEGQEEHTGSASDDQAQDAAVHLHGLAALSRVEEGMIGDTPGNRKQGFMWESPEPPHRLATRVSTPEMAVSAY